MKKYVYIGSNIRAFRTEKRLTQADLATRAGISRIALIHIEHSKALPSLDTIMSLSEVLNLPVSKLLSAPEGTVDEHLKNVGLNPNTQERCELEIQAIESILKRCALEQLEAIRKTIVSHPIFQENRPIPTLKAN